ncbi:alpha/beta fold hydrolase [Solirubrobacter ginsenosidimutans]|uniref:Alpha/beta fold hydrolase n=1 Tax=Solirubrobacter ginsenosidimutans TaxID=490573 RepID=A0A9X3MVP6_9ACTN|nr:alpha/beta fold hydrolase [Solirubrobacter ginsenosidimutans]MDA0160808.1 alpha/beta fold hydrolase [Solirubrobacter ginsenosidimutans]
MARAAEIRFLPFGDRRVAYELSGTGPPVVAPAWWVSHLELEQRDTRVAQFWEALTAGFTLVRYDQLGVGLSDRSLHEDDLTLEHEVALLAALVDHLGFERVTLLGASGGGAAAIAFAARQPERVEQLLLYGTFADGNEITTTEVRQAILASVRAHWGLGSRVLADIFLGDADREAQDRFARFQREAATGETAAALLELVYRLDVRAELERVRVPTLVAHRRGDRAIPYRLGRELAAAVPDATFVPLAGSAHFPWFDDAASVVRALRTALAPERRQPVSSPQAALFSPREREVLALVARGLSDKEIAELLVLSPHTVHRHVANIRHKLGRSTRTAAVAEAARLGLL